MTVAAAEIAVEEIELPSLPTWLRWARRQADFSQRQLAAAAQVAQSTITRLETGEQAPSAEMLIRLLAVMGCTLSVRAKNGSEPTADFGMGGNAVKDAAGRQFPPHLDVRKPTTRRPWWYSKYNTVGAKDPLVTFSLFRGNRNLYRTVDRQTSAAPDERVRFLGMQSEAYIPYLRPKPGSATDFAGRGSADLDWW